MIRRAAAERPPTGAGSREPFTGFRSSCGEGSGAPLRKPVHPGTCPPWRRGRPSGLPEPRFPEGAGELLRRARAGTKPGPLETFQFLRQGISVPTRIPPRKGPCIQPDCRPEGFLGEGGPKGKACSERREGLPPPFFRPALPAVPYRFRPFFRFFFKLYFPGGYSFLPLPRSAEKLNEEKCYNKKLLLCSSLWEISDIRRGGSPDMAYFDENGFTLPEGKMEENAPNAGKR